MGLKLRFKLKDIRFRGAYIVEKPFSVRSYLLTRFSVNMEIVLTAPEKHT
jgi:hypothetical protein